MKSRRLIRRTKALLRAAALATLLARFARADDVSAPVVLQYFESKYTTIESRMPDIFKSGYGAIYTPPPAVPIPAIPPSAMTSTTASISASPETPPSMAPKQV